MRWAALALLGSVALVAGCGSTSDNGARSRYPSHGQTTPLPATAPYVEMTGSATGWAVWPSGGAWLVLATADGFAHVENRTPIGVETDGGLVASLAGRHSAVAVLAHERLLRSPVLTATSSSRWTPSELPGAVADSRAAVSSAAGRITAITTAAGGTLVRQDAGTWLTLTRADTLAPKGSLALDGVTWASPDVGWLTGHGQAGTPMAYRTSDGGARWTPLAPTAGRTVAALAPCGSGSTWLLPTLTSDGTLTVLRTSDAGARWSAGAPLSMSDGEPAWGCAGAHAWIVASAHATQRIFSSSDGGAHWTERGPAPADPTDLTPTTASLGIATSAGATPQLWRVSGDGSRFTRIALPSWVATLGAQTSDDGD